jgi:hypothetical protein
MLLRCGAEEAHEHRHICMSYGRGSPSRQLMMPGNLGWADRTTNKIGGGGAIVVLVLYITLRRYATQVWS